MKVKQSKQISVKDGAMRVSGGGGHMSGKNYVGTQKPGSLTGNKAGNKSIAVKGGGGHMFGKSGSKPSRAR
jgi:hypothetical protein